MTPVFVLAEPETPSGFVAVAKTTDVPSGWVLRVTVGSREVALAHKDGEFYALDNSCTHAGGPLAHNRLSPTCTLECPWHYSVFDVRTGSVISGPARKPAKTYPVHVHDETVYVSVAGPPPEVEAGGPPGAATDG